MNARIWKRRALKLVDKGKWVGCAVICPDHLTPLGGIQGFSEIAGVKTCNCIIQPDELDYGLVIKHGLGELSEYFSNPRAGPKERLD